MVLVGILPSNTIKMRIIPMRTVSPEKERAIMGAADELVSEGVESPTNDNVRAKLGGGSIADISPTMRKWRVARKEQVSITLAMPESVKNAGERFMSQLWSAADAEAGKAVDTLRREHAEQIATVEAERDEALGEISRVEDLAGDLRKEVEAMQRSAAEQAAKLEELQQANQALSIEREKTLAQAQAGKEAQKQMAAQIKEANANNKELQKELVALAHAARKK